MQVYIPAILAVVISNALSQTLLKQGMGTIGAFTLTRETAVPTLLRIAFDPFVVAGLILMVLSMAGHLYVLSRVPLTFAFPFISISYIVVLGVGYFRLRRAAKYLSFDRNRLHLHRRRLHRPSRRGPVP